MDKKLQKAFTACCKIVNLSEKVPSSTIRGHWLLNTKKLEKLGYELTVDSYPVFYCI